MGLDISENEELLLPCRHCLTLCVPFRVAAGATRIACPRCRLACDIHCERRKKGWAISVVADGEVVAIWE